MHLSTAKIKKDFGGHKMLTYLLMWPHVAVDEKFILYMLIICRPTKGGKGDYSKKKCSKSLTTRELGVQLFPTLVSSGENF